MGQLAEVTGSEKFSILWHSPNLWPCHLVRMSPSMRPISPCTSLHPPGENNFINTMMKINLTMKSQLDPPVYIGLHDISEENGWEWTDDSLVKVGEISFPSCYSNEY